MTTGENTSTKPSPPAKRFRADIQGMRALAVLAVIMGHLFGWPKGGFLGVDVFFVLSGFLITSLLLREYERTGRISFLGFYKRRIKRILPASSLVLVVVVVVSFFLVIRSRWVSTAKDAIWSALFSGNWRFAITGTDYFQAGTPPSPLQHYWSLGVEEQFYFVWPWLLMALLILIGLLRISGNRKRLILGTLVGGGVLLAFLYSISDTSTQAAWAYFSTLARVWELGVGALLAVCVPLLAKIPPPPPRLAQYFHGLA